MKKILLLFSICIILVGCGNYSSKNLEKDLEKKINKLKSYQIEGNLEITSNDDVYKYKVEADYKKDDNFRVSLTNQTNNHKQIILKNKNGVYVLTPSLNKSFKFQSDWPYNNSQSYLLQTLLSDIQNDSEKTYKETKNHYIYTLAANYPNNTDLVKQKIYFTKDLKPCKVEVMNENNDILIKMTFTKVKWNPSLKNKNFELENNMDVSKEEESTKEVSEIDESIFPMYIPENTKLTNTETVFLDDGERVIMTFEGDSPFMFIKQTASTSDKLVIESVYGEPYQIATGVAAVSDNMITWTSNGLEYYVVSEKMSDEELVSVASSLATMPVSK